MKKVEDEDTDYFSEGGVLRQIFRIKKVYLRSIVKHSDKLSDLSDVVIKVTDTISDKDIDNNSNSKSYNFSRIIRSIPTISTKDWLLVGSNIIIGSLSFYPYENNVVKSPFFNGLLGGSISGIFTTIFDKLIITTKRKLFGTILSHSISFSALFSSYEISKGIIIITNIINNNLSELLISYSIDL